MREKSVLTSAPPGEQVLLNISDQLMSLPANLSTHEPLVNKGTGWTQGPDPGSMGSRVRTTRRGYNPSSTVTSAVMQVESFSLAGPPFPLLCLEATSYLMYVVLCCSQTPRI